MLSHSRIASSSLHPYAGSMSSFNSDLPFARTIAAPATYAPSEHARPPLPEYWDNEHALVRPKPLRYILKVLFTLLCLIAFGRKTLRYKWDTMHDDAEHDKYTETISNRLTTLSVVVSSPRVAQGWGRGLTRGLSYREVCCCLRS